VPADTKILRFYLNAHTFGTDGWPHTDADRPNELTTILYLTQQWRPEWCGETVVFNKNGDIEAAVMPRANRLLAFPSDRLHSPRPLSKSFEELRVVLVVKMGNDAW
jgi:Rps23 Pro-64 3,4-dihydroxylase Tpa1-like proline 4-hydroxylase